MATLNNLDHTNKPLTLLEDQVFKDKPDIPVESNKDSLVIPVESNKDKPDTLQTPTLLEVQVSEVQESEVQELETKLKT